MRYERCTDCKDPIWQDRALKDWFPCATWYKDKKKCDSKRCLKCSKENSYCKVCRAEEALTEDPEDPSRNVAFGYKALRASTTGHENTALGADALMKPKEEP